MESRNVRVIDEHNIDRVANVICSIDVDGSDYAVYWIERDNDNDNLFVSKLVKNNDGTSNMVNIDDSMEKGKISDIVKELVTYAVNKEEDTLSGDSVMLPSGKNVKISSVIFNKEQNINVQKTYITTVKKSVTKVGEKFYEAASSKVSEKNDVFNDAGAAFEPKVDAPSVPDMNPSIQPIEVPQPAEPVLPESSPIPTVEAPVIEPVPTVEPILPTADVSVEVPKVNDVTPILPTDNSLVSPLPSQEAVETPVVNEDTQNISAKINIMAAPTNEEVKPVPSAIPTPVSPTPAVSVAPIFDTANAAPLPSQSTTVVDNQNNLVFDGSKESNLSSVLGQAATENQIPVSSVEPIREFGQDAQNTVLPTNNANNQVNNESVLPVNNTQGYANNKFFTVIAVIFFLASCVFLGYEVFRYLKLK